jgi:type IV secretory pathway VirB10-like protein
MAAGAVALVVLSVVVTFWFVNRPSASSPAPAPVAVKTAANSTPPPTIVAPAVTPPVVAEKPAPKPAAPSTSQPVVTGPAATPPGAGAELAPVVPPPATVATAAPEASAPSAAVPTDPRIHAFVDAIKVMGIRSSGGDSRVLMNDRVFRVNDIVERTLGVRLISVAPDSLTFSDSNGGIYVKYF